MEQELRLEQELEQVLVLELEPELRLELVKELQHVEARVQPKP